MAPHQMFHGRFLRHGRGGTDSTWKKIWDLVTCGDFLQRMVQNALLLSVLYYHYLHFYSCCVIISVIDPRLSMSFHVLRFLAISVHLSPLGMDGSWAKAPGNTSQVRKAVSKCSLQSASAGACREAELGPDAAKMPVQGQRFEFDFQSMDITAISVTSPGQFNPLPCCFASITRRRSESNIHQNPIMYSSFPRRLPKYGSFLDNPTSSLKWSSSTDFNARMSGKIARNPHY